MTAQVFHYDIKVFGRVQGVGYRAYAMREAKELGLRGFVKNMIDGSVYIEAEGSRELLDQFFLQCEAGPGWAHVEKVTKSEAPVQSFNDFKVKY